MGSFFVRAVVIGAVGLLALPACGGNSSDPGDGGKASTNEKSLFLVGVLDINQSDCVAKGDKNGAVLAKGRLDLAFSSSYTARLLVGNQFQSAASTTSAPETERVTLSGADVSLATAGGTPLEHYSTVGTGFIDAAADTAAYGAMAATLIPTGLHEVASLQGDEPLVATIKVTGEALDGTKMTSSALTFPIDVCTGCLVQYPPEAADPTQATGAGYRCATAAPAGPGPMPCTLGQDMPFSCIQCAAANEICRDPSLNPAYQ